MRKLFYLITITSLTFLSFGCKQSNTTDKQVISIVYTSPHPVINEIINGFIEVVRDSFPDVGFIERHANGQTDEYSTQVQAAIRDKPSILVPITTPISKIAVQEAPSSLPIVFLGVTDPVGAGIIPSLELPEKATGACDLCPFESLIKLTRELFPKAKILGLPYNPVDQPAVFGRKQIIALAPQYGFEIVDVQVTSPSELPIQIKGLARKVDVVLIAADNLMMENPALISESALEMKRPTVACDLASVEKGAVAGVSVNYKDVGAMGGLNAIKVLKGIPVKDIPVAVLSNGEIALNLEAACRAGIRFDSLAVAKALHVVQKDFICN